MCALALAACGTKDEAAKDAAAKDAAATRPDTAQQNAAEAGKDAAAKPGNETADAMDVNAADVVKISVPTMQCETCVEAITKGVKGVSETQNVRVDLDSKTVFVKVAANTPETQQKLEDAISKCGYSTASKERDPKAYEGLPDCCKDGGMKDATEKKEETKQGT